MAYRSQIETLAAIRTKGQRPYGYVVVSDTNYSQSWAQRNGMFHVPMREVGDNVEPFVGLMVLFRTHEPARVRELAQRIAVVASLVTIFDTNSQRSEQLVFERAAA